jgi:hypothetical protein
MASFSETRRIATGSGFYKGAETTKTTKEYAQVVYTKIGAQSEAKAK